MDFLEKHLELTARRRGQLKLYLTDNKAWNSGKAISSISSVQENRQTNLTDLRDRQETISRDVSAPPDQRELASLAVKLIDRGHVEFRVSNAGAVTNTPATGVKDPTIRFQNTDAEIKAAAREKPVEVERIPVPENALPANKSGQPTIEGRAIPPEGAAAWSDAGAALRPVGDQKKASPPSAPGQTVDCVLRPVCDQKSLSPSTGLGGKTVSQPAPSSSTSPGGKLGPTVAPSINPSGVGPTPIGPGLKPK
jgi:hypothetical protein